MFPITRNVIILGALAATLSVSSNSQANDASITECDQLAAHPWDPQKIADGVYWNMLRPEEALRACKIAITRDPSPRHTYQYARTLAKSKQYKAAAIWYRKAADLGYAQAQFALGDAHEFGEGMAKDLDLAGKWYKKAVAHGHVQASDKLSRVLRASNKMVAQQIQSPAQGITDNL